MSMSVSSKGLGSGNCCQTMVPWELLLSRPIQPTKSVGWRIFSEVVMVVVVGGGEGGKEWRKMGE